MPTLNVSAISGDATPMTLRAEDLGTGSADSVANKVLALHHHDAIYKAAFDNLYSVGLTKNYLSATTSTSGDSTLVAAPGSGNRFSIGWIHLNNESATETTVIIKSATTERYRAVLSAKGTAGSFRAIEFPAYMPLETIANQALVINLSGANSVGYSLAYVVKS